MEFRSSHRSAGPPEALSVLLIGAADEAPCAFAPTLRESSVDASLHHEAEVATEKGQGSCFTVRLPCAEPEQADPLSEEA